ncbi:O-antigen ligase family protein [Eubacterium ramulus]
MNLTIKIDKNNAILPSILYALMFDIQALAFGLMVLTHRSFLTMGYVVLIALTVLCLLLNRILYITKETCFVAIVLVIYYVIANGKSGVEPIYFGAWVLLPVLLSCLKFNTEYVLRYTAIFVIPLLLLNNQMFAGTSTFSMGTTYNFFPAVLASTVHFMFYRKEVSKWMYIAYIGNIYYFYQVLLHGSRGPVLAVILCFIFVYFCRYNDEENRIKIDFPKFLVATIGMLVIYFNYLNIFSWIAERLGNRNLNFNFIDKVLRLAANGDVTNGRNDILSVALKEWIDRPIFGHGISTFNYYTGIDYPHNFILQLLFDGGIVLFIIVVGLMIRKIVTVVKHATRHNFVFFVFLFFVSVPTALLSQDLFENFRFWMFEFALLNGVFTVRNPEAKYFRNLKE